MVDRCHCNQCLLISNNWWCGRKKATFAIYCFELRFIVRVMWHINRFNVPPMRKLEMNETTFLKFKLLISFNNTNTMLRKALGAVRGLSARPCWQILPNTNNIIKDVVCERFLKDLLSWSNNKTYRNQIEKYEGTVNRVMSYLEDVHYRSRIGIIKKKINNNL